MSKKQYATADEFSDYLIKLTQNRFSEMPDSIELTPEQSHILSGIGSIALIGDDCSYDSGLNRMKKDYHKVLGKEKFTGKGKSGRPIIIPDERKHQMYLEIKQLIANGMSQNQACKKVGMKVRTYGRYKKITMA